MKDDLLTLQKLLGVTSVSDTWDTPTAAAVIKFQQAHGLPTTGLPDPRTLVTAGIYQVPDEHHGSRLWRDLVTSSNQIPQLGWLFVAAGLGGLAYAAYRRQNPSASKGR